MRPVNGADSTQLWIVLLCVAVVAVIFIIAIALVLWRNRQEEGDELEMDAAQVKSMKERLAELSEHSLAEPRKLA